ncbi:MAG: hypothetical protein ACOYMA_05580 [Bacteroidia bacterium]
MKKLAILIVILFPIYAIGQTNSVESQISNLENLYIEEVSKNVDLSGKVSELENKIESIKDKLKASNDSIASQSILLQKKTNNLLELQAQSEEAVNLSLEGFEKKYLEQNKSIEYLNAKMKEDLLSKLIFYGLVIFVFSIAMYFAVKMATKDMMKKQQQGWLEFNESLFKK